MPISGQINACASLHAAHAAHVEPEWSLAPSFRIPNRCRTKNYPHWRKKMNASPTSYFVVSARRAAEFMDNRVPPVCCANHRFEACLAVAGCRQVATSSSGFDPYCVHRMHSQRHHCLAAAAKAALCSQCPPVLLGLPLRLVHRRCCAEPRCASRSGMLCGHAQRQTAACGGVPCSLTAAGSGRSLRLLQRQRIGGLEQLHAAAVAGWTDAASSSLESQKRRSMQCMVPQAPGPTLLHRVNRAPGLCT